MSKTYKTFAKNRAILTAVVCLTFALVLSTALPTQRDLLQPIKCSRGFSHLNNYSTKNSNQVGDSVNDVVTDEMTSNDVSFMSIRPSKIGGQPTVTSTGISADDLDTTNFGAIFRQCAPYIAMHSGCTMVIHLGGQVMQNRENFESVLDDISILHLLGVRLVLVAGVRLELDNKLLEAGKIPYYHDGMRITDQETMQYLKETSGSARFEIESSLARGFRGRPGQSGINVVSGNFFYSAKPLGVRDGVDYKLTGEVRRIEVDNLNKRLEAGDIVLLTSVGYCPSGEVFNVPSDSLAAECAAKLKAAKIIYMTDGEQMVDTRTGKHIQSLRLVQAVSLLDLYGIKTNVYNQVEANPHNCVVDNFLTRKESIFTVNKILSSLDEGYHSNPDFVPLNLLLDDCCEDSAVSGYVRLLARCVYALSGGVRRAHLLAPSRGALLKELYTRDGAGILISRDVYEGIRQAQSQDVRAVEDLIRPLEKQGILVPRAREQLEKDLPHCILMTRDGSSIACAMLKRYSGTYGEVSMVAVHPSYQREGRGETLLSYLERRALHMGITQLFVLSTRTMQWFEERGFVLSDPSLLPSTREYNKMRGSKVYIKQLGSQRDVDAEELLWNV